jgi:membrane associated rhomboid family serine protease
MKLTVTLIIINVITFFFSLVFGLNNSIVEFGFKPSSFLAGKVYTIVTSLFIHASFEHVFFNMIALFLLGTSLEKCVGKGKYLLVYFLGGIIGNLVTLIPFLFSPDTIGVGASGAISALVGLGMFICPGKLVIFPSVIPLPFVIAGTLYFLITVSNILVPSDYTIGYPVHMMGIIVGSIFGLAWSENWKRSILIFIVTLILILSLPYILDLIF